MEGSDAVIGQVTGLDGLDAAFERSDLEPVVLFNHDPWCPVSARAHRVMSSVPHPVLLIDVSRCRDVTREIERRTGVSHESPQVLVVRDGAARWSSSHFAITMEAVVSALTDATSANDCS